MRPIASGVAIDNILSQDRQVKIGSINVLKVLIVWNDKNTNRLTGPFFNLNELGGKLGSGMRPFLFTNTENTRNKIPIQLWNKIRNRDQIKYYITHKHQMLP